MMVHRNQYLTMAGLAGVLCLAMSLPAVSQESVSGPGGVAGEKKPAVEAPAKPLARPEVVATYSEGEITRKELERMIGPEIARLQKEIYDLEERTIRQMVSERLLRAEAIREHMTRDKYYDTHVTDRIVEPPEAEVKQVMEQYRSQLPKDDETARKLVVQALKDRQKQRLEKILQAKLLGGAKLKILLEEVRFPVEVAESDPVRGPEDAPVTIVEFSDYQCPFCSRVQPTLHKLLELYPDSVQIVFKNMPGQRHDRARPAAEAALCAGRQGKFWEMHDWLYAHQNKLDDESIQAEAKDLGLDMDAFGTCLSKHETAAQIDSSLKEARELGLTGTPIFFVNGRMIRGAQPFDVFDEAVRSEMERLGIELPPAAGAAKTAKQEPSPEEGAEKAEAGGQTGKS